MGDGSQCAQSVDQQQPVADEFIAHFGNGRKPLPLKTPGCNEARGKDQAEREPGCACRMHQRVAQTPWTEHGESPRQGQQNGRHRCAQQRSGDDAKNFMAECKRMSRLAGAEHVVGFQYEKERHPVEEAVTRLTQPLLHMPGNEKMTEKIRVDHGRSLRSCPLNRPEIPLWLLLYDEPL